jgi:hypothetical protein
VRAGTTAADPFTGWIPRAAIQSSFGRHRGGTSRLKVKLGIPGTFALSIEKPCALIRSKSGS